jgi:tripartite-type tricarboxylate transporter receptor subunit TctC
MKTHRREFLHLTLAVAALPAMGRIARAQAYPMRQVKIVVGLPPGLAPDIVARLIGPSLSDRFGQSVIVENRPGSGGIIGAQTVARAPADGHTLLLVLSGYASGGALYPNIPFNFVRDIAPVALIGSVPYLMCVNPSFPAKTVPEFIAYAKANPGRVNMASPGAGTAPHLAGELFKMMTGTDLVHVPYRESYMPDLLSGQVQVSFPAIAQSINYIRDGKLRGLAVTNKQRLEFLPDIPTLDEFVSGYDGSGWVGVGAPQNTPIEIVEALNTAINSAIADQTLKERFVAIGVEPAIMRPAQFGKLIVDATEKWTEVVKFAGIKPQ